MPKKLSYSNYHLHAKRDRKRKEAEARQANYDSLTVAEKFNRTIGSKEKTKLQLKALTVKTADKAPEVKAAKPVKVKKSTKN